MRLNRLFFLLLLTLSGCKNEAFLGQLKSALYDLDQEIESIENPKNFGERLSNVAIKIIDPSIVYTPDYVRLDYPNGDVPAKTGVCTDVVIRAFRRLDIDLQKEVHEDMKANFSKYPKIWGLAKADTNIDHRRGPNLEVFFERKGKKLHLSANKQDYLPGDIVTWNINGKMPHIGIVTHIQSASGKPLIVHNAGWGQVLEDCLFLYPMVAHFRYQ